MKLICDNIPNRIAIETVINQEINNLTTTSYAIINKRQKPDLLFVSPNKDDRQQTSCDCKTAPVSLFNSNAANKLNFLNRLADNASLIDVNTENTTTSTGQSNTNV